MVVLRKQAESMLSSSGSPLIKMVFIKDVRSNDILNDLQEKSEIGLLEISLDSEEEGGISFEISEEPQGTKTWSSMQGLSI